VNKTYIKKDKRKSYSQFKTKNISPIKNKAKTKLSKSFHLPRRKK